MKIVKFLKAAAIVVLGLVAIFILLLITGII